MHESWTKAEQSGSLRLRRYTIIVSPFFLVLPRVRAFVVTTVVEIKPGGGRGGRLKTERLKKKKSQRHTEAPIR